ncbi:hypothetical protein [Cyanobium sp. Tous-M-B4]|nr:hypothetical protein [Cyanobium sp. Tous-M-B4]MCP9779000.1 hypothetical protein [Cyanobium sp. Tous-M-B4]
MGPNAQGTSYQVAGYQETGGQSDALEVYFECITTCSLDDGACVTRCVEELREQP